MTKKSKTSKFARLMAALLAIALISSSMPVQLLAYTSDEQTATSADAAGGEADVMLSQDALYELNEYGSMEGGVENSVYDDYNDINQEQGENTENTEDEEVPNQDYDIDENEEDNEDEDEDDNEDNDTQEDDQEEDNVDDEENEDEADEGLEDEADLGFLLPILPILTPQPETIELSPFSQSNSLNYFSNWTHGDPSGEHYWTATGTWYAPIHRISGTDHFYFRVSNIDHLRNALSNVNRTANPIGVGLRPGTHPSDGGTQRIVINAIYIADNVNMFPAVLADIVSNVNQGGDIVILGNGVSGATLNVSGISLRGANGIAYNVNFRNININVPGNNGLNIHSNQGHQTVILSGDTHVSQATGLANGHAMHAHGNSTVIMRDNARISGISAGIVVNGSLHMYDNTSIANATRVGIFAHGNVVLNNQASVKDNQTAGISIVGANANITMNDSASVTGNTTVGVLVDNGTSAANASLNITSPSVAFNNNPVGVRIVNGNLSFTGTINVPANGIGIDAISGNITIDGGSVISGNSNTTGVQLDGGSFTLENGTFTGITNIFAGNNGDIMLNGGSLALAQTLNIDGYNVSLSGTTITRAGFETSQPIFNVSNGGMLNITQGSYNIPGRFVQVSTDGTLTMNGGTIISSSANSSESVRIVGGTFIMNDGIIQGDRSSSAVVWLSNNADFTMNGGTIANAMRGVWVSGTDSTFIMNGGIIENNAYNGVRIDDASFTLAGNGIIRNNDIGVIIGYIHSGGYFTMNGGTISDSKFEGVRVGSVNQSAVFNMNRGFIERNNHGVYIQNGNFTMSAIIGGRSTVIANNTHNGVWLGAANTGETFTMSGGYIDSNYNGVTIENGNFTKIRGAMGGGSIQSNRGTGVAIYSGKFIMDSGNAIVLNQNSGVRVMSDQAFFDMRSGSILANRAPNGGGIFWENESALANITVSNTSVISGNTATEGKRIDDNLNRIHNTESDPVGRINPKLSVTAQNDHSGHRFDNYNIRTIHEVDLSIGAQISFEFEHLRGSFNPDLTFTLQYTHNNIINTIPNLTFGEDQSIYVPFGAAVEIALPTNSNVFRKQAIDIVSQAGNNSILEQTIRFTANFNTTVSIEYETAYSVILHNWVNGANYTMYAFAADTTGEAVITLTTTPPAINNNFRISPSNPFEVQTGITLEALQPTHDYEASFIMPQSDVNIRAIWQGEVVVYQALGNSDPTHYNSSWYYIGRLAIDGIFEANTGSNVSLEAGTVLNYDFVDWTIPADIMLDGDTAYTNNAISFIMPSMARVELTANFDLQHFIVTIEHIVNNAVYSYSYQTVAFGSNITATPRTDIAGFVFDTFDFNTDQLDNLGNIFTLISAANATIRLYYAAIPVAPPVIPPIVPPVTPPVIPPITPPGPGNPDESITAPDSEEEPSITPEIVLPGAVPPIGGGTGSDNDDDGSDNDGTGSDNDNGDNSDNNDTNSDNDDIAASAPAAPQAAPVAPFGLDEADAPHQGPANATDAGVPAQGPEAPAQAPSASAPQQGPANPATGDNHSSIALVVSAAGLGIMAAVLILVARRHKVDEVM